MHDAAIAIEDVRLVLVRLAGIEGEKVLRDRDRRVACGRDGLQQIERAAEFLVKDGARKVEAVRGAAVEKESAAHHIIRLVDRDVGSRHVSIPDEKRSCCQSAEAATNDVRLHLLPPASGARMA